MPRQARPWFRFYSEQLESRKAQTLRRENPALYGIWIGLLCVANVSPSRGTLPPIEDVIYAFRPDPADEIMAAVDSLTERRFVDRRGSKLVMHQWSDWQKDSDANKTPGRQTRNAERTPKERGSAGERTPKERRKNEERTHRGEEKEKEEREREERETRARKHANPLDQLFADFAEIGLTNGATVADIEDAVDHHGLEKVQMAVKKARASGKSDLPWSYVDSILEGKGESTRQQPSSRLDAASGTTAADRAEIERSGANKPAIVHLD